MNIKLTKMSLQQKLSKKKLSVAVVTLVLSALSGCGDSHHDNHGAEDKSEAHHGETAKDDHQTGNAEEHHGDNDADGHHEKAHDGSIGEPGIKTDVDKTVSLVMNDQMRFEPASIEVKAGETIQFDLKNSGALTHEMVIGETEELIAHGEMMKKHPGMEHEEPNMLTLEAGTSGELIWKFTNAGTVNFACLQAGHYDAGMKGSVTVN